MSGRGITDSSPHILVVDDDSRLRQLLHKYLLENDYRVSTAPDAAEARRRLEGFAFDLIVLDVMMPGEDGLALTESLRRKSDIPILLLTAMSDADDRVAGLERGADDYLPKPFEPRELLLRIANILKRVGPREPEPEGVRLGDCYFDAVKGELTRRGNIVHLTTGEAQLLKVFARNPGVTVSRTELSDQSSASGERAVDVQITRLRRKIEVDPRSPRYLQTVWGEGYVLWPD